MVRTFLNALTLSLALRWCETSIRFNPGRRNCSTRGRPESDSPTPIRCEPESSALPRASERPVDSSSESSANGRPTTWELFVALKRQFERPKKRFPMNFPWVCGCGKAGFPGCKDREHFCERVYLALLDYHQHQETKSRNLCYSVDGGEQLLRVDQFSARRMQLLEADLEKAETILRRLLSGNPA